MPLPPLDQVPMWKPVEMVELYLLALNWTMKLLKPVALVQEEVTHQTEEFLAPEELLNSMKEMGMMI